MAKGRPPKVRNPEELFSSEEIGRIYGEWWGHVFLRVWRKVGNRQTAEDLAAQTFINLWARSDKFRGDTGAAGDIRPALNNSADHAIAEQFRIRQRQAERELVRPIGDGEEFASSADDISEAELRLDLSAVLEQLPERERAAFTMCHLQGLSSEEIGAVLGVAAGTAR